MNELNLSSYKLPGKVINFQEKHFRNRMFNNRTQGPRSNFLSERWGGGRGGGVKEERVDEIWGGGGGMLGNCYLRAAPRKYRLNLEIAKKSHFSKLDQNEALRALITKILF